MEKEQILHRWEEYIGELYDDQRPEIASKEQAEGPSILEQEVIKALKHMKAGKAPGADGVTTEMFEALGSFGTLRLTNLLNKIYDTGNIPEDMSKSIFIALPKKTRATECEDHRTISLMSHTTKILLRIIMNRIRPKIRPEIAEEQFGFMEGKGTINAIFALRMIIERALEVNKDIYLCFIDYTKAFDRVKHAEIIEILQNLNIDSKDLRIIENIYWEQTAALRLNNNLTKFQKIKRGVRQGCVLSPDLFSLYSEIIIRAIKEMPGIKIGGCIINNLRYADDTVLVAEKEEDLQKLLDVVVKESEKKGLDLNIKKNPVTMVITKKATIPGCNIQINDRALKQVEQFKYLGTLITQDGRCETEVKARIAQAKSAFVKMKSLLTNKSIGLEIRKKILRCYIEPILLYGCEAWTLTKKIIGYLEGAEMWFFKRMQRVAWSD